MRSVSLIIARKSWICVVVGMFSIVIAQAQTENSPYSRYGLGDILPQQHILSRGMGGVSAAYYDAQSVNFLNPASYSRFKMFTTLDLGLEISGKTLRTLDPPRKYNAVSPIISYVQLGIPLSKKRNWGMNFGLRPITRINYKILRNERVENVDSVSTLFEGNGGTNQVYIGTGFGIKNFSVGFNFGYLFGSKDYSSRRNFVPDSADVFYYGSNHQVTSNFGGWLLNAGVQYAGKLNKTTWLRLGAYGNLNTTLGATRDVFRETYTETELGPRRIDSVFIEREMKSDLKYPASYGVGFIIDKAGKWMFGVDYTTTKWSGYRIFDEQDLVDDSWKVSVGGQITPSNPEAKGYWSHVTYRAGLNIGKDYYRADGELPVWTFSLGAGLPMRKAAYTNQYTVINTSFEFGQRGNKENKVRENLFRLNVGFTLSDIWFIKRKYE